MAATLIVDGTESLNLATTDAAEAKNLASVTGWTRDDSVRSFRSFVKVLDFENRLVHEYDAETGTWYEVEMAEGV